ncbi:MAG: arylsulfatase, partial [Bacteroides sp.]
FVTLFFVQKSCVTRTDAALYIKYVDVNKDANGLVRYYFPSSRGIKTSRYTLALYINKKTHQLTKSLLFDDLNDPYQMNNLPLDKYPEVVSDLYRRMGELLKEIDDPWYKEKILSDRIPY